LSAGIVEPGLPGSDDFDDDDVDDWDEDGLAARLFAHLLDQRKSPLTDVTVGKRR